MLTHKAVDNMFDEKLSLVDYLPYADHLDGFFLQVDGSLGQVWELTAPEAEGLGEEGLGELAHTIAGLLSHIPQDVHAQLIAWTDGDTGPVLAGYRSLARADAGALALRLMEEKVKHISSGRDGFWKGGGDTFHSRRIRVLLTVRQRPVWSGVPFKDRAQAYFRGTDDVARHLQREWRRVRSPFERVCAAVESQLAGARIGAAALDRPALTDILYAWLNPRRSRLIPRPCPSGRMIREEVVANAPLHRGSGFILEGQPTRVITLKDLPHQTSPGMFAAAGAWMDIHHSMAWVINFAVPDQAQALERVRFQKNFAFLQRGSSTGDVSEEAVQKKEELSQLITETFKSGKAIIQARGHVLLWGRDEDELERACDRVLLELHRRGGEGLKEEIIAPSLFLSCLPLNFDHEREGCVRRERRLLSDNFADMAPLFGAMRGSRTPASVYLNRRGEPVPVDLFDSETNPHAVIIGASGAGKSFLTNDFIYQNYRLGAHFFVLDKGHSYRKACELLGGQYVHFELGAPVTINPFPPAPGGEEMAFLIEVLALMASGCDERDRLLREEKGFLQLAVGEAYRRAQGREVTLSDLVAALEGELGQRLRLRLAPFTRSGPYGRFFDGPNQFRVGERFTVFELADLGAHPDLQLVVLLNIMFFVTRFVASEALRGERKYLLIDEAWQLLKMGHTADFIANAFKTFRKYRCAAVAITQEVGDLIQQKSGLAILANTANKIFLKQEASVIERLKNELSLSPAAADLLRGVRTVKGKYSEALVMTPSTTGVVRLVPDPFLYWVATSDPRDNACLARRRQELGGDLVRALEACVQQFPCGVREEAEPRN